MSGCVETGLAPNKPEKGLCGFSGSVDSSAAPVSVTDEDRDSAAGEARPNSEVLGAADSVDLEGVPNGFVIGACSAGLLVG